MFTSIKSAFLCAFAPLCARLKADSVRECQPKGIATADSPEGNDRKQEPKQTCLGKKAVVRADIFHYALFGHNSLQSFGEIFCFYLQEMQQQIPCGNDNQNATATATATTTTTAKARAKAKATAKAKAKAIATTHLRLFVPPLAVKLVKDGTPGFVDGWLAMVWLGSLPGW